MEIEMDGTAAVLVSLGAEAGELELTGGKPANIFADAEDLFSLLAQLAGYSSMCWDDVEKAGVFRDDHARVGVDAALERAQEILEEPKDFLGALRKLINMHSRESGSMTPDFVLAKFLEDSLNAYETAVGSRDAWYGVSQEDLI